MSFWELHSVSLPEFCLVAKRRWGLANLSCAFNSEYYKCNNRVLTALIILCISTVSLGWLKSLNVFSAVPLSPCRWEFQCGIGWAANQSLLCPFAAPAPQSVLFLFHGGSAIIVGPLWVAGHCLRDSGPLGCSLNLPHGGHMGDTILIWILFLTLPQTLCATTLTIFLRKCMDILVKYCGWMENANKSDILKPVQVKKPPGLQKFPRVSWGCGSQSTV